MHKNVQTLSWFNFFIDFAFYAPIAVLYFAQISGSYALGMSIYSIAWVSSALFEIPTGMFSDMIGRRNTVVAGAVSALLSVIVYALAQSYWMLVVGALFEGLGRSFYSGNNDALLHDSLHETGAHGEYHEFYGKLNTYNEIGLAIVVAVGPMIASISYPLVFWVSAIPRLILVFLAFRIVEPQAGATRNSNIYAHLSESLAQFRKNRKLRLLTVISAIRTAVYEGAYQFRTAFVATIWPLWAIGLSNMISNVGAAASFFYSGNILGRFGYKRILVFEIIINRIINLTALLFPSVVSPALMGTTSLSYGVTTTAVNSLLQREFTQKERATLASLSSLFGSIGFGACVILLGSLSDRFGPIIALLIAHIGVLSLLFFYRKFFSEA